MNGKRWRALAEAGSRGRRIWLCASQKTMQGAKSSNGVGVLMGAGPQTSAAPFSLYPKEIREQKSVKENWLIYRFIAWPTS